MLINMLIMLSIGLMIKLIMLMILLIMPISMLMVLITGREEKIDKVRLHVFSMRSCVVCVCRPCLSPSVLLAASAGAAALAAAETLWGKSGNVFKLLRPGRAYIWGGRNKSFQRGLCMGSMCTPQWTPTSFKDS